MKKQFLEPKSPLMNEHGIALPLVLIILVLFSILSIAAYNASQSSLLQAQRLNPNLRCKYLARSAVDATIEAWSDKWMANPASAPTDETFYTSYNYTSDEFLEDTSANEGKDGVIKTEQDFDKTTGICTITSSVKIGTHSATVTAKSEKLIDPGVGGLTNPWYDEVEYESLFFGAGSWKKWSIIPNPDPNYCKNKTDKEGHEYYGTYYVTDGIVNIQLTNASDVLYANGTLREDLLSLSAADYAEMITKLIALEMPLTKNGIRYNVTGFQAKCITFKNPLNLYLNTSVGRDALLSPHYKILDLPNPHSLIVSAETIVFDNTITIGDSYFGNLTLSLPPGSGISGEKVYHMVADADKPIVKQHLSDKYGLVTFKNVDIRGSLIGNGQENDPKLISGKTFFFRPVFLKTADGETNSLNIGTESNTLNNLTDWLGISKTENDFRFKTLLSKGYLVPAPGTISAETKYDVLFMYE